LLSFIRISFQNNQNPSEWFAALPVNTSNDPLITFTTVTLGDELFIRYPSGTASPPLKIVHHAVIVGDPDLSKDPKWFFPDLPGARQEAIDVGSLVGVHPLLGAAATHVAVLNALKRPQSLDLIYIATHAITDRANPQDGSFLALAGGDLLTREVEKLQLAGRPLVILSACQTGLGKEFDGGIFGMAFSWHLSGAGTVVTSLWNVDDEATHDLMTDFVARMKNESPSRAMAETMRHRLESDPDYRNWASFVVYGNLPTAPVSVTQTTPIATKRLQR
jgi:CHAT domain-containing protein